MPPERINATTVNKFTSEPDFFSDVYQLGLMIYLIWYNTEPFSGYVWEDLAYNIKNREADFPPFSFSGFPIRNQLINVVKKCLSKKPSKRYAGAEEIYKALLNITIANPTVNYSVK
jgi:serine/threonine protein kinase